MIDLYTKAKVSPVGKVNKADLSRWGTNLAIFLAPLGIVYVLQLNATVQNGTLGWDDLLPSAATIGAIQLYLINAALDLLRKFTDPKK